MIGSRGEAAATRLSRDAVAILTDPAQAADPERVALAVQLLRDAVRATRRRGPNLAARLSNLSGALHTRYLRFGAVGDLDEAVRQGRRALALARPDDPHGASYGANLAAALTTRFGLHDELRDLEEAISAGRRAVSGLEAVGAGADSSPQLPGRLSNLCSALRQHWERTSDRASLAEAVDIGRRGAALAGPGHPQRAAVLSNLSSALHARHGATGAFDDLVEAVAAGDECVILTSDNDENAAGRLSNVGLMARDLYERTGELVHLDRAVSLATHAARLQCARHNVAAVLSGLGGSLVERFEATGDPADLAAGIDASRQALAAAPAGHPGRPAALLNLSNALQVVAETAEVETTSAPGSLDEAVALAEEAISGLPSGHPFLGLLHNGLGVALRQRFEASGQAADIERAVFSGRTAVDLLRVSRPGASTAAALGNLSSALQDRYEYGGRRADLDEAEERAREAMVMTDSGDPLHLRCASTLVNALRLRVEAGEAADAVRTVEAPDESRLARPLDEAVELAGAAVRATPPAATERLALRLINLSVVLRARADLTFGRNDADTDAAVQRAREAWRLLAAGRPLRPAASNNLAVALETRYEMTGHAADLDAAVRYGEEAVDETPAWHADRARYLSNHGAALHSRFELTGAAVDLEAAVESLRAAVDATMPGDSRRAGRLANLSSALRRRHLLEGRDDDATEAVRTARDALAATPAGHADRTSHLTKLSLALLTSVGVISDGDGGGGGGGGRGAATAGARAENTDGRATQALLDEARSLLAEAVAVTPSTSPAYLGRLSNQAGLLLRLFERTGSRPDLEESLSLVGRAVDAAPAEHPDLAVYLSNLGRARYARFEITGEEADRAAAENAFASAARSVTATPTTRAGAARGWATCTAKRSDWPTAVTAGELAIQMLARVVGRGLARPDQERRLTSTQGLASLVAACALADGQPERAVELLDQARGVLLGRALDMRSDVGRLAEVDPELATRFVEARNRLDAPADTSPDGLAVDLADGWADRLISESGRAGTSGRARSPVALQERRRTLAARFDDVVDEVRRLPGFGRFLLPPESTELREAATEGPVVAVNVHGLRSDALIVTRSEIFAVPLPELSPAAVSEQALALLTAVETATDPDEGTDLRETAETRISDVLRWLWENVTAPVLDALDQRRVWEQYGEPRRLWWCPTGALTFLPLHAAGRLETVPAPLPHRPSPTVLDSAVCSYTSTIRALLDSRRPLAGPATGLATEPTGITVVALPVTPGQRPLRNAAREAGEIAAAFPNQVVTLTGPEASREKVLAALAERPWVHLACHGVTDLERPSQSALLVYDHLVARLTVTDVLRLRLDRSELAYLSACSTAEPSIRLPDESIHLASAFQAAGYRHVIATLWSVQDLGALRVARSVYSRLRPTASTSVSVSVSGAAASAEALHAATLAARRRTPDRPSTWAAFVHHGA